MFFAHLSVEKMLKAHVVKRTKKIPPKIHNLERLAQLSGLKIGPWRLDFLRRFEIYQLEGRYPDTTRAPLDRKTVREDFQKAVEMIKWLKDQL